MESRLDPAVFAARRAAFLERMGEGVALFAAAPVRTRNRDVEYPYRPDSDFYYLTGCAEPEAVAVLAPGREPGPFLLFVRPRDPDRELWTGPRLGTEGAVERLGADEAFPIGEIDERMPGLLEGVERLVYPFGRDDDLDRRVAFWINQVRAKARSGVRAPRVVVDAAALLHEQRLFKDEAEIALIREACAVTARGHAAAMRVAAPGVFEHQVQAAIEAAFLEAGATWSYPPICASGANACTLHYVANRRRMEAGDLLLVDAGAEVDLYAGDVTRTFPVSGRFRGAQRDCYEVVLAAQQEAIARIRPGARWDEPHRAAVEVLTQGMVDLGLLAGDVAELVASEAYKRFYPHRTGHWLGMDVHDVGDYRDAGGWRRLEPGMVFTVEPGLYVAPGDGVPERFAGIGIRIEDDCRVTETGCEVLTAAVPKEAEAVEAAVRGEPTG
ncbi:MAG: M24 family metallopeptidase [Nitrospirae bacterium]|nr:MAG: M24 family metallopeptidase [Nitrospirota bacterium]